jgi:hypothetical protein
MGTNYIGSWPPPDGHGQNNEHKPDIVMGQSD